MILKANTKITVRISGQVYSEAYWMDSYVLRGTTYNSVFVPSKPLGSDTWAVEDKDILEFPLQTVKKSGEGRRRQLEKSLNHYEVAYATLSNSGDLNDKKVQKELAKLASMISLRKDQIAAL